MEINKKLQRFLNLNKPFDSESSFQSLVLIPRLYRAGSKPFYVDTILAFGYIKAYIN